MADIRRRTPLEELLKRFCRHTYESLQGVGRYRTLVRVATCPRAKACKVRTFGMPPFKSLAWLPRLSRSLLDRVNLGRRR